MSSSSSSSSSSSVINNPLLRMETTPVYSCISLASEGPSVYELGLAIRDKNAPIGLRMRSVFMLRTKNTLSCANELANSLLATEGDSVLLRHELAFVLGQMGFKESVDKLTMILENIKENVIVRHEAGEALGAIADPRSLPVLEKFCNDPNPEVSETCIIAVERVRSAIQKTLKFDEDASENIFLSVDPAPPLEETKKKTTDELCSIMCDESVPLYKRYRAMFSLRNRGQDPDVLALCKGLKDSSALFRHEVAYVLGQLAHPLSLPALCESLKNEQEHAMVRHEAAEAIGAIGNEESEHILKSYATDGSQIVRESCEVALDVVDYWRDFST